MNVAIVHDYLTQRGGAERVVLELTRAFPGAPVYTSLYDPAATFPEFEDVDVRPAPLNRIGVLRRNHRLALPLLAPTFSRMHVDADVVVCSSSGWAHGARTTGRKIVYCHAPARWLYQPRRYAPDVLSAQRLGLAALRPVLLRWDARAAASADTYVVNSTAVRERVGSAYGIAAAVAPPPPALTPAGERSSPGLEPGFWLVVSRLLPYKNVAAAAAAFAGLDQRLVVVGAGPDEATVRAAAGTNVSLLGEVSDATLRWLYDACMGLVAPAYEDYGLTPLEAASFGKPTAALRFGGYLDTVAEGRTGTFFETPAPATIRAAVERTARTDWDAAAIAAHARRFSAEAFHRRLRELALR